MKLPHVNEFGCESSNDYNASKLIRSVQMQHWISRRFHVLTQVVVVSLTNLNQEMSGLWEGPVGFVSDLDSIEIDVAGSIPSHINCRKRLSAGL